MPSLFELSDEILALEQLLYEAGGELPDEETERIIDGWLAETRENRDTKLDGYAGLIRELEARASARRTEAQRLKQRADVDQNLADQLATRLEAFFAVHGLKTIETARFRLTRAKNGGKVALILHIEPEQLPDDLRTEKVVYLANKDEIRKRLEAGEPVEGTELAERGYHMLIK